MYFWKMVAIVLMASHLLWFILFLDIKIGNLPSKARMTLECAASCPTDDPEQDTFCEDTPATFNSVTFEQGMWVGVPRGVFTNIAIVGGKRREHICSGVQIHERYVLTAAHCIDEVGPNPILTIRVYSVDHGKCQKGVKEIRAQRSYKHPNWTSCVGDGSDIAVIQLRHPVPNLRGYPMLAAPDFEIYPNCKVCGFQWAPALQMAKFDVVKNHLCPEMEGLQNNSICAYSAWGTMVSGCSGGPVMMLDIGQDRLHDGLPQMDVIVGIVSSANYSATIKSGVQITPVFEHETYQWIDSFISQKVGLPLQKNCTGIAAL